MLIGANKQTRLLYKRTYFMLNKEDYVELVTLSSEIRDSEQDILEGMKVYKTDSRELKINELNSKVSESLSTEKVIEHVIELDQIQFDDLANNNSDLFNYGLN